MNRDQHQYQEQPAGTSSRILDIPCKVCGDFSSGKHYNIFACDGCAGFFKRSIRRNRHYMCKSKESGACVVDKTHRNQCRACRFQKCQAVGMNREAVQHERGPRNSTLRKQHNINNGYDIMANGIGKFIIPNERHFATAIDIPRLPMVPPINFMHHPMISLARFPLPNGLPPSINFECSVLCESAARLIFTNLQLFRGLDDIKQLFIDDQVTLLQESWVELFILGASRYFRQTDLTPLTRQPGFLMRWGRDPYFLNRVQNTQDVLAHTRFMQLDHQEYMHLINISVFKTGFQHICSPTYPNATRFKFLTDIRKISAICDTLPLKLQTYIDGSPNKNSSRYEELLKLHRRIRTVSGQTVEELFFRDTIGNKTIPKLITDMYEYRRSSIS